MIRYLRKGALAFALLGVSLSSVNARAASPAATTAPAVPEYKADQIIIMKEAGKPDRRCAIVAVKKQSDGTNTYQVKALDNGELMTIHDRVPANAEKKSPVASNSPPSKPNAMKEIKPPLNVAKLEADLPRAQPRSSDPILNSALPTPPKAPTVTKPAPTPPPPTAVATAKPASPSVFDKVRAGIFGRAPKQPAAPCNTCETTKTTSTAGKPMAPVAGPKPAQDNSAARVPNEPISISHGPRLPVTVPQQPSTSSEPQPLPLYEVPIDPARQALAVETQRLNELKDNLKNALRPSHRMAAAEELCAPSRITEPEIRAAVMLAAQDDPAGCVRAACIRGMARAGLRDQAYMTLLVACQTDKDQTVREEAGFAMQRVTKR